MIKGAVREKRGPGQASTFRIRRKREGIFRVRTQTKRRAMGEESEEVVTVVRGPSGWRVRLSKRQSFYLRDHVERL